MQNEAVDNFDENKIERFVGEVKTLKSVNAFLCQDEQGQTRLVRESEHPEEYSILEASYQTHSKT